MMVTPEQIIESLLIVARNISNDLLVHDVITASDYKDEINEIQQQYEEMTCY